MNIPVCGALHAAVAVNARVSTARIFRRVRVRAVAPRVAPLLATHRDLETKHHEVVCAQMWVDPTVRWRPAGVLLHALRLFRLGTNALQPSWRCHQLTLIE